MADRYCSNCGHELSEDSRFCPNCGRPVHETAHVPTPEADVPVPPPPGQQQAGGTPNYAPTAAAPRQRSLVGRLLIGCAGLLVLGILFVGCLAVLGGGGGGTANNDAQPSAGEGNGAAEAEPQQEEPKVEKKPKPEPKYSVGQTA